MKIRLEESDQPLFYPYADIYIPPPWYKPITPEEQEECTVTLFGSLLDGGY